MNRKTVTILDIIFSALLMGSFLYASIHKEKFNESLQYNLINFIASFIFGMVGVVLKTPGLAVRQFFFGLISGYNLLTILGLIHYGSSSG